MRLQAKQTLGHPACQPDKMWRNNVALWLFDVAQKMCKYSYFVGLRNAAGKWVDVFVAFTVN